MVCSRLKSLQETLDISSPIPLAMPSRYSSAYLPSSSMIQPESPSTPRSSSRLLVRPTSSASTSPDPISHHKSTQTPNEPYLLSLEFQHSFTHYTRSMSPNYPFLYLNIHIQQSTVYVACHFHTMLHHIVNQVYLLLQQDVPPCPLFYINQHVFQPPQFDMYLWPLLVGCGYFNQVSSSCRIVERVIE